MVIGTICVNFVSISPLTDWLVSAFYFLFFFVLFLLFHFRGTELWFHILVKDWGCDLFWVGLEGEHREGVYNWTWFHIGF